MYFITVVYENKSLSVLLFHKHNRSDTRIGIIFLDFIDGRILWKCVEFKKKLYLHIDMHN